MPHELGYLLLLSPVDDIPHSEDGWVIEQLHGWLDLNEAMAIHSVFTKGSHVLSVGAAPTSRYLYVLVSWLDVYIQQRTYH